MAECKSQASCTARRVVSQIRTIEQRAAAANKRNNQRNNHQQVAGNQTRRQFSYTFDVQHLAAGKPAAAAAAAGKFDRSANYAALENTPARAICLLAVA